MQHLNLFSNHGNKSLRRLLVFLLLVLPIISVSFITIQNSQVEVKAIIRRFTDNGYTCDYDTDLQSLTNCELNGSKINDTPPDCVGYNFTKDGTVFNRMNCKPGVVEFKDGQTAKYWGQDNLTFFRQSDNTLKRANDADAGATFYGCFDAGDLTVGILNQLVNSSIGRADCDNLTLAEFEAAANVDLIAIDGSDPIVKSVLTGEDLEKCKENTSADGKTCKFDGQDYDVATGQQKITETSTKDKNSDIESIIAIIFNLVSAILLILVWLLSWVVFWVFWAIATVFLILIRLNPAGSDFISVAIEPWKVVVSMANLLILASFIFVGFAYLLNLKNFKKGLSELMVNMVIVAITINFTIFGAATFVNITQGIGDVFVSGYAGASGQSSQEVVRKITNALNGVSYVRCGSLPDNAKGATADATKDSQTGISKLECVDNEQVGEQLKNLGTVFVEVGDISGENVQRLMREFIYLMIILYAITIFIKAIKMALIRVVGLWLLMIVSPLALVAYFSPFDKLKKFGQDWISYFWVLAIFYPAFIFGWIIVGEMSTQFTNATQNSFTAETTSTALAGVTADAQTLNQNLINGLILVVLGGIVTVALLNFLIEFFDKTFKKVAEAGLSTLKDTVGAAFGSATGLYAKGIRTAGKIAPGAIKGVGALKDSGIRRQIENNKNKLKTQKLTDSERINLQNQNATLAAKMKADKLKREEAAENISKKFERAGDTVEYLPRALGQLATIPKNFTDNFAKQKDARIARMDSRLKTGIEQYARTNPGAYNALKAVGYELDADPNLSNFTGVNPDVYKSLKNQGKGDYLEKESKSLADRAFKNALGIKEKLDDEVLDVILDEYADQKIKGGKLPKISKTQMKQALNDPGQRNKILRNESLSQMVRDNYEQFNDPGIRKIIQTQAPSLLPENQIADATRALSLDQIKELDPASADHPVVAATLQNMGERNSEVASLLNKNGIANGLSAQADEQAKRELKLNNSNFSDISPEQEQVADKFVQGMVRTGLSNERDIISRMSQMKAAGKSEQEITAEYDTMTNEALTTGIDKTLEERNITDSKVKDFIKKRAQSAHAAARETHLAKVQNISKKAAEHIESFADGSVGDNLAISTMKEIGKKKNAEQYLQNTPENQQTIHALGLSGGVDKIQKAIDRGELQGANGVTGRTDSIYFENTDTKTTQRAVKKMQKYAAATIQGDFEARDAAIAEIEQMGGDAKNFFDEQVKDQSGIFWDHINDNGVSKVEKIIDKAKVNGGGNAGFKDSLRDESEKRKKNIEKRKEATAKDSKKAGADNIYKAMHAGEIGVDASAVVPNLPDTPIDNPDPQTESYNPPHDPNDPFSKPL